MKHNPPPTGERERPSPKISNHERRHGRSFFAKELVFSQRMWPGQKNSLRLISPKEPGNGTPQPSGTPKPCTPITQESSQLVDRTHQGPTIGALHGRDTFDLVLDTNDVATQKNWATNHGGRCPIPQGPINIRAAPPHCALVRVTHISLLGGAHPHVVESHRPSLGHPACGPGTIHQLFVSWNHGRPHLVDPRSPPPPPPPQMEGRGQPYTNLSTQASEHQRTFLARTLVSPHGVFPSRGRRRHPPTGRYTETMHTYPSKSLLLNRSHSS